MAEFTKGPWRWDINPKYRRIELFSRGLPPSIHETVMDFERWGMQSASPRLRRPGTHLMAPAHEFAAIIPGREHHASLAKDLDHPDARLIASAPDLYAALDELLPWAAGRLEGTSDEADAMLDRARAALAKAREEAR